MGGGFGGMWTQQRSLRYLEDGQPDARRTLRRLRPVLRPHLRPIGIGVLLVCVGVVLGLVPPLLIRAAIDQAIPLHRLNELLWLAFGMLLFPAASAVVGVGQNYLSTVVAQRIIHDLRQSLYRHGQRLGLDFFTWTRPGEIHARFISDLGAVQQALAQSLIGTFVNVLTVLLTLGTMLILNWRLALIAAISLPAFAIPVLHFGKRRYEATQETQTALADLTSLLEETLSLSGVTVVKSYGREDAEAERFGKASERVRDTSIRQSLVGQWVMLVVQVLSAVGPAALYGYGGYLVVQGQVALGTIVAFATYLARLYGPASSLASVNTTVLGALALFDRVFHFLDVPVSVPDPRSPLPLPPRGSGLGVAFRGVHFTYPQGAEILHGITCEAPAGQLTALVGPSGAGKTTILSLASRFYDPEEGEVEISGVPLRRVANAELRQRSAVVTQEVFLFHATLRENIAYGQADAQTEAVERAARQAQLGDLLDSLPEGLETVVGERGYRLSGGEKQRVAIARAILHDPELLLLDEATSSLDSQAEALIQQALSELFSARTVIAIAHRLSTILQADQILVVDEGRIVASGTHQELVVQDGLYRKLYETQFAAAKAR